MYKTVAVVTRYFGGVKLGTGGLTRAYGGSVSECLEKASIRDMQQAFVYTVEPDYEGYSRLLKFLNDAEVCVLTTEFDNLVKVKFAVKQDYSEVFKKKLIDAFNGKIELHESGFGFYDFKVKNA